MKAFIMGISLFFAGFLLHAQQVKIVVPGKGLVYNGVSAVPEGLMGVHLGGFTGYSSAIATDWGITSARGIETIPSGNLATPSYPIKQHIQCWYDRYVPAPYITNPSGWRSALQAKAASLATSALNSNYQGHLEFWNEPYLNWAYKPGVNTDPQYYDTLGVQAGDSVKLKGQTRYLPYVTWQPGIWFKANWASQTSNLYVNIANTWNARMSVLGIPYPGLNGVLNPGEIYNPGSSRQFEVVNQLRPTDPTQHSFYSATFNGYVYRQMFKAAADTIKAIYPDFNMIGGFGFESHVDNWAPWTTLFKPLIDNHHHQLDGLHEHHYGMDTRIVASDYETMYAYAKTRYGKKLKFYNTETGGYVDPQRGSSSGNFGGSKKAKALQAFTYHLRDIIYMAANMPDKAINRAIHEPQNSFGGAKYALQALKGLRGNLLYSETDDDQVWSLASLSADTLMFVAVFNNAPEARSFCLGAKAPLGLNILSANRILIDSLVGADTTANLQWLSNSLQPTNDSIIDTLTLGPKLAAIYYVKVQGNSVGNPMVSLNQYFADSVLQTVYAGSPRDFYINISTVDWMNASSARMKMALYNASAQPEVSVNNQPLPYLYQGGLSKKNAGGLSYAAVPLPLLGGGRVASLTVSATTDSVQLWSASLEISSEPRILGLPKQQIVGLGVYPNPAKNTIRIANLTASTDGTIINTLGQHIGSVKLTPQQDCSLPTLNPGVYILQVNTSRLRFVVEY